MLIKKCKHVIEVGNNQSQVLFSRQRKNCPTLLKRFQQPPLQHHATYSYATVFAIMSVALLLMLPFNCVDAVGYSYSRFSGPVSGPEYKIIVNDDTSNTDDSTQIRAGSDAPRFDYVGKPEYEFAYGVEDADSHVLHNRNEMRDGDTVKGVYSLIDPDGTLRVVKYTADEINGFQAEVIRNGVSSLHDQLQHHYIHAPPPKTIYNNQYNPAYNPHSQPPPTLFKGDRIVDYPSSNPYKSNVVQLPTNKYETIPKLPTIYHYNKNYDDVVDDGYGDGDGDGDRDGDYNNRSSESEDQQPHYEVHEKPENEKQKNQNQPPHYKVHEKPDEDNQENQDDDDLGYKSDNYIIFSGQKDKKQHLDEYDNNDDDDDDEEYNDGDDSEEMADYDEGVHATHNSEESYEYY